MSEENKEKMRRVLEEAFGQGKVEVMDEVLHSDFVCWDPNSETGEIRGADTIKGEIEYFRNAVPDLTYKVEDQIDRFDESGKLVEEWPEYDLLGAMQQIGAVSESGQEEATAAAAAEEREEKGLMDKAKEKLTGQ